MCPDKMKKRILILLSLTLLVTILLLGCDISNQKSTKVPIENIGEETNDLGEEVIVEEEIEGEEQPLLAEDFEITLGDKAKISEEEIKSIYSTDIEMLKYFDSLSGRKAPDFKMIGLDGEEKHLSDFEGENVILEFMGSWCPVCVSASKTNDKFNK